MVGTIAGQIWRGSGLYCNTSKYGRSDPHSQLWRKNRNHQNVRDVSNLCLLNQKVRREDEENTAPVVSPSEIQSDIADAENGKGALIIKARREVLSFLYSVEGSLVKIPEFTIWLFICGHGSRAAGLRKTIEDEGLYLWPG